MARSDRRIAPVSEPSVVSEMLQSLRIGKGADGQAVRPLGVFAAWRLQAYGYTLAAIYAAYFLFAGWLGLWLVNSKGVPRYQDFTTAFAAGLLALHGNTGQFTFPWILSRPKTY